MSGDAPDILLVEDNPYDAELTLRALDRIGLAQRVRVVSDGAAALDYFFAEGAHAARPVRDLPQLVLLDLKLPKVDGHEVLRRLRSDARTRGLPVVVLTSSAVDHDVTRSYELGANSYVVKPVEFDSFAEAVSEIGRYWLELNATPRGGGTP